MEAEAEQQQPVGETTEQNIVPAQISAINEQQQQEDTLRSESHHDTTTTMTPPDDKQSTILQKENDNQDEYKISITTDEQPGNKGPENEEPLLNNDNDTREKAAEAADQIDDDGFVIIDPENSYRFEKHKASFFAQMEKYLIDQVGLCSYYKKFYEEQKNGTLANLFSTHLSNTNRDLDLLRTAIKNNEKLPKYKLETLTFNGIPTNVDLKEKELQLVIRTSKLPVSDNAQLYVIGEFSFSLSDQTMSSTISRWFHHVKVDPKNLVCCSVDASRQLDIIYSTDRKPFTNPASEWLEFDRPMMFNVSKGKSRTHKRKFKPIKLTFFERTNLLKCDKKLGTIQLKVDSINDEARIQTKQVILNGRKDTGAFADIKIKVWKPLVETTIRAQEEKLLILS